MNNQEILAKTIELITERASSVANEKMAEYQKENSNAIIDTEVHDIVIQRATSELMMRMGGFKPGEDITDGDDLVGRFDTWFLQEEEPRLAQMCTSCIKEELKKRETESDANLTFTEKFKKAVREKQKSASTANIMNDLLH